MAGSDHAILDLGEDDLQFTTNDYKVRYIVLNYNYFCAPLPSPQFNGQLMLFHQDLHSEWRRGPWAGRRADSVPDPDHGPRHQSADR